MFKIKRKPKCFGGYNWKLKCDNCKYEIRCIDFTNCCCSGTRVKITNRYLPHPTPKQPK